MRTLVTLLGLLTCQGCADYQALLDGLSSRQVTSCVWLSGAAGPWVSVRAVTATGGAELAQCMQH